MKFVLDPLSPTGVSKEDTKPSFRPYFAGGPGKVSLLDSVNGKHGAVQITGGTNVTVDNSAKDTIRISATGGSGSGVVETIVPGNNIDVDATDPANPIVAVETLTLADVTDVTASTAEVNVLDGIPATLTATELGYSDGVTSSIQTQLDAKLVKASNLSDVANAATAFGNIKQAASDTATGVVELATTAETTTGTDAARAVTPDGLHDMTSLAGAAWFLDEDNMASDSATKTSSQQAIKAYVDAQAGGGTVDTVVAGNNIDVDATDPANPIVSVETLTLADVSDITASTAEVNVLDGIPAGLTATELGYMDGVTSSVQTQLNAKAADADVVHDTGNETVAGVKTFTDIPVISGANGDLSISADTDGGEFNLASSASGTLAIYGAAGNILNVDLLDGNLSVAQNITTQGYVKIDSTPAADHTGKGIVAEFVANENQAIGDVCYINSASEMQLADADAIATSVVVGMCIDATIAADATGNYLLQGIARDDTWAWTVGGPVYLSTTGTSGNTLTQTAPSGTDDCVVVVGIATHADRLWFNPSAQGIVEVV